MQAQNDVLIGVPLCSRCRLRAAVGNLRVFWDGRMYCSDCLDTALPGLASYLQSHSEFHDVVPCDARAVIAGLIRRNTWAVALLVLIFMAASAPRIVAAGDLIALILAGALLGACAFALGLLTIYPILQLEKMRGPREYTVTKGVVFCRTPLFSRQFDLKECEWSYEKAGNPWRAEFTLPRVPMVVLWHRRFGNWGSYLREPCGLNADARELWIALLGLANVQRRKN